jgi:hypothetical protein
MGPFYKDYGSYIIKTYPNAYLSYFIAPNIIKYFKPPGEYLEAYNAESDRVLPIAQEWFHYKSTTVKVRLDTMKITLLEFYPILAGVMNIVFICSLICILILKEVWDIFEFHKAVLWVGLFWILNVLFSILSTAGALRFLAFSIILTSTFAVFQLDWLIKKANSTIPKNEKATAETTESNSLIRE